MLTMRDQTSNRELLQRLEQQDPRMKPLLPETYEVPGSDEAFPPSPYNTSAEHL